MSAAQPQTTENKAANGSSADEIIYILKGFPRLSESFIANEVRLLIEYGLRLRIYSIKRGDELAERGGLPEIHYLPSVSSMSNTGLFVWLFGNVAPFLSTQLYWVATQPIKYFSVLRFSILCARQYRGAGWLKKTFFKEFLFASYIARCFRGESRGAHIHAHFCHDATTVAWMASQLSGLPFSFTAHAKDIYQAKLNPGDLLERKLEAAEFVITCTQTNVIHLAKKTLNPKKIHGIYHGLNTQRFRPSRRCYDEIRGVSRLLSVGRHVEKKGFAYLIEACAILRDQGLEIRLDIVGEQGDQSEALIRLICERNLLAQVQLCDPVTQSELTHYYHRAHAFVLPSVIVDDGDRDGIPNVMAEAMACGLPVVVSRVSGIPELVEDGVNGILVEQRDVHALVAAIRKLLRDGSERKRLGDNARRCIESRFDAKQTHKDLLATFGGALESIHAGV